MLISLEPEECSAGFWEYIDILGKKIDLEGWTRYRGDMRPPGTCWFDEWRDIESMMKKNNNSNSSEF
jgi:hypothetical protein